MRPLIVAIVTGAVGLATPSASRAGSDPRGRVEAHHPWLQASLIRLWEGSPTWRASLSRIDGHVRIFTPDQVLVEDGGRHRPFDDDVLAEVTPVVDADGRVRQVTVVVNLALVEAGHAARLTPWIELESDLDRILAHEVYGHAVPYLLAGHLAGHCPDPRPGEPAEDACAIRRENVIRAELGLGRRTDAGLQGLALGRRVRH
jgi:hypothetical protein